MPIYDWFNQETMWSLELFVIYIYIEYLNIGYLLDIGLDLKSGNLYCVGFAWVGKDIVFKFILEYSSLRDFGPYVIDLFFI
jgi:hypothetical protein